MNIDYSYYAPSIKENREDKHEQLKPILDEIEAISNESNKQEFDNYMRKIENEYFLLKLPIGYIASLLLLLH